MRNETVGNVKGIIIQKFKNSANTLFDLITVKQASVPKYDNQRLKSNFYPGYDYTGVYCPNCNKLHIGWALTLTNSTGAQTSQFSFVA